MLGASSLGTTRVWMSMEQRSCRSSSRQMTRINRIGQTCSQRLSSDTRMLRVPQPRPPQGAAAVFWKGLLLAYYYQGLPHVDDVANLIEPALQKGLPPALLTSFCHSVRVSFMVKYRRNLINTIGPDASGIA